MQRGYIRQVRRLKGADQLAVLEAAGIEYIYQDTDLPVAVSSLRKGDELVIAGGLQIFGNSRRAIVEIIGEVHEIGATVRDLTTGYTSEGDGIAMLDHALAEISHEHRFGDVKKAARKGAAKRWAKRPKRMSQREALVIWRDPTLTTVQALEKMNGWTATTAYRKLKHRGITAGRMPKQK